MNGEDMEKVLIIAYHGCTSRRIFGLAKYLPEFGWQPVILAMPHGGRPALPLRIKEWLGPILHLGGAIINYPDAERGWKPLATKAGKELLEQGDIHTIISSSPPVISHLIARELKDRYNIPWLADFRDLWSQNYNYSYGPVRKWLDRRLELKTLSQADALIAASRPAAEKLRQLHKGKTVYSITHGFDPVEVNTPSDKLTDRFTIIYTGTIYAGKQDPIKLLAALRGLIADGTMDSNDIDVSFYGNRYDWLDCEIKRYGLANTVTQYGLVVRDVAIEKQRESQLLLLLNWEDTGERGVYTAKVFEYLAARRPILAIGGLSDDMVGKLLEQTKAGVVAPTVEDVKRTLLQFYQEFKRKGEVSYHGDESEINKYSHREMARQFVEILEKQGEMPK